MQLNAIFFTGEYSITTRVLVVNGNNHLAKKTEIIDMENADFECTKVQPFPILLYGATGGLIADKIPFICGGFTDSENGSGWKTEQACYQLTEAGTWIEDQTAILNEARGYLLGSVVYNNSELVVSGGSGLKSIELISPNAKPRTLSAQLPKALFIQCTVAWDADTFMVIGGGNSDKTYLINVKTNQVTNGPPLNIGRQSLGCAELEVSGSSHIVVSGGSSRGEVIQSTEVLDKNNIGLGWQKGKIRNNT